MSGGGTQWGSKEGCTACLPSKAGTGIRMSSVALTCPTLQGPAHLLHLGVLRPVPDAARHRTPRARPDMPDQSDLSASYGCHLRSSGHVLVWGEQQAEE